MDRVLAQRSEQLSRYSVEILDGRLRRVFRERAMVLDDYTHSFSLAMDSLLSKLGGRFEKLVGQLDVLSPLGTLSRGYSITSRMADDSPVVTIAGIGEEEEIKSRLKDGTIFSRVTGVERLKEQT
jgi:exodeoxyribonuclease VII large subunit